MISPYSHLKTSTLIATKSCLLGKAHANDLVDAHLDAIEVELDRRFVPMIRRESVVEDGDDFEISSISYHCPNCDGRNRPLSRFCTTCGQGLRPAAK